MKKYWFSMMLLALFGLGFTASDEDFADNTGGSESSETTPKDETPGGTIAKVTKNIGKWDVAYVTDKGYFCYNDNVGTENEAESEYSTLAFKSTNGSTVATIIATKDDNVPTQIVTKTGTFYFSYAENTLMELVFDDGENATMLGSVNITRETMPGLSESYTGDIFKQLLANVCLMMKVETSATGAAVSLLARLRAIFEAVVSYSYDTSGKSVAKLAKDASGNYKFIIDIYPWVDALLGDLIFNTFYIWTGEASFKVGGSSGTLSGTIWSPSNIFNELGTYGIVCDEDATKLMVGAAEYEESGFQSPKDVSFSVDFRGFKPNTTYYYRAYYKFNSADHGNLIAKQGNTADNVVYDPTIKKFTTGDNVLTVDVVMCIDVTGSMSGIINTVKTNAMSFFDSFKNCCDKNGIILSALNAQVISFRDKNVDTEWLTNSPTFALPAQIEDFNNAVKALYADGGGDTPESGLEALDAAFKKTDWGEDDGYHRQVVILWTDAPYLVGAYSDLTVAGLQEQWNAMSSGRRLILFAPNENYDYNGGSWSELDGWKNLIHVNDLYSSFYDFDYILESIIGELTSKAKVRARKHATAVKTPFFNPNN